VDDLLHDTPDVAMALGIVEAAELGRGLPQAGVGSEDAAATLTLVANLDVTELLVSTVSMSQLLSLLKSFSIVNRSVVRSASRSRWPCRA
jgi:hypothetical protein